ncbi:MAG TPA: peptide chain release factor N(5)-glutamine methyltransferase [Phycisphaerales bacterium]|nr:peptide chain release factor N(5)-glutamine methyltransferase [Phycisphaerales bacterium]
MTEARTAAQENAWTSRRLLAWVSDAFTKRGLDSPKLSAEILLSHVLKTERLKLYLDPEREASKAELDVLRGLVGRALKDEPVQYLTQEAWFFGLPFHVDKRVLVPRPCTEVIVETVLQRARSRVQRSQGEGDAPGRAAEAGEAAVSKPADRGAGLRILDLCTGSGCIAVTLAKNLKGAEIVATDLSPDALAVAAANAARHGVAIDFRQGDLFSALRRDDAGSFHFIVSNPPYIPDREWVDVPANVKNHEPELALRGGADGMRLVTPIVRTAPDWLAPDGVLMVETAASTAADALKLAEDADRYADGQIVKDLEGHDRFLLATAR